MTANAYDVLTVKVARLGENSQDEITPEMLVCAREAFRTWLRRWDALSDGLPGEPEITQLLRAIIGCGFGQKINPLQVLDQIASERD